MYYRVGSAAAAVCQKGQSGRQEQGVRCKSAEWSVPPSVTDCRYPADKSGAWRTAIVRGAVRKHRKVCAVVRHGLP